MASNYSALGQGGDDIQDSLGYHDLDGTSKQVQQGPTSTLENTPTTTTTPSVEVQQVLSPAQSPRSPALSHSTATVSTATPVTMATTPSPSAFLSLADQTLAPLDDKTVPGDHDGNHGNHGNHGNQQLALERDPPTRLLSPAGIVRRASSTSSIRSAGPSASNTPLTAGGAQALLPPPGAPAIPALAELAARGATTVSYMVQSYEALRAARIAAGYDLVQVSSKASATGGPAGSQLGASPSPSPSPSPSGSRSSSIVQIPNQQDNNTDNTRSTDNREDKVGYENSDNGAAANDQYDINDPSPDNERSNQLRPVPQPTAAVTTGDHSFSRSTDNQHDLSTSLNNFSLPPLPSVPTTTTAVANTTVVRPTPESPKTQRSRSSTLALQQTPPPRTSSTASIPLSHPTPDTSKRSRSGAYVGNIAALEATAERFSLTSSIEEAIRNEHNELKRSDSRRSAILQANSPKNKSPTSDTGSSPNRPRVSTSRTNSIRALNSAARLGGYSPGGYVMTPNHSLSGVARSGSKSGSIGELSPKSPPVETTNAQNPKFIEAGTGEEFPFARHGPGKSSVREASRRLSLAQIAELDHPITITQDAIDEADHAAATGVALDDDEAIAARAHQQIEPQYADEMDDVDLNGPSDPARQPMLDHGFFDQPTPRLQLHQPVDYQPYEDHHAHQQYDGRPLTSESRNTFQQAHDAFGDFDGVHCDPDVDNFAGLPQPAQPAPQPRRRRETLQPRPKSYFDPSTGQEMLYYPAPVPAMLNLPPKLAKNPKAGARNMRRSQVLSVMQQSSVYGGSRDNLPMMAGGAGDAPPQLPQIDGLPYAEGPSETGAFPAQPEREIRRPQRLTETDRRKSRATMLNGLPPQLRASAFFDLPSSTTTPHIELKDGSATATLDTILDASATAPVSAFTDHAFAGKLGPEVYGVERKKIKKSVTNVEIPTAPAKTRKKLVKRNSSSNLLDVKANKDSDEDEGWTSVGLDADEPGPSSRRSPEMGQHTPNPQEEEEEEELVDGEPVFNGPPTTLLAELQMRKQKDKMMMRPAAAINPHGLHATLLELNAVAEMERKQRINKRVNLAWEDPTQNPTPESDDEDVPLGMLYAAKAVGAKDPHSTDIAVLMSEVNRPLGLMERRELEENEPLSQRRNRLRGSESQPSMSLNQMQKRMSHMTLTPLGGPNALGNHSQSRLTMPLPRGSAGGFGPASVAGGLEAEGSDAEGEGETLAARKARLAAENPLPRARPVSAGFSSELLSELGFGANEENRPTSKDSKGKAPASGVPEEEETLGQRRKRLQAEREAREREMAAGALPGATQPAANMSMPAAPSQLRDRRDSATLIPFDPNANANARLSTLIPFDPNNANANARLSRRLSLSDVLNSHPVDSTGLGNPNISPLEQERLRREAEGLRQQRAQEAKMAAIRAQMPQALAAPAAGARTGGFMGGIYNGGNRSNPALGQGLGIGFDPNANAIQPRGLLAQQQVMEQPMARRASTMTVGVPMPMGGVGAQYGAGAAGYGMGMGGYVQPPQQYGAYGQPVNTTAMAPMQMNMGMPMGGAVSSYGAYGAPMQFQTGPGQMGQMGMLQQQGGGDMVERWRQSVMP